MIATRVSAVVLAVSGMGIITLNSGSAHADTPCDSWHLQSPVMTIDVGDPNRSQISIDWDAGSGISPSTAETNARWKAGSAVRTGNASGSGGPTSVDLSFNWPDSSGTPPAHFTGKIDPQFGSVNGTVSLNNGNRYDGVVSEHFECVHHAAAPAAPVNQAPAPDAQQAPKDGVTMQIDQSDPTKVVVTVTNTSPLDGQCTYDATKKAGLGQQDVNKSFSLAPGADTVLTFLPVPLGSTYHVVVSCHGTFNGQDDEFGRKEQDVSGQL
jgi:hypothetical protein